GFGAIAPAVGGDEHRIAGLERDLRDRLAERRRQLELATLAVGQQRESPAGTLLARLVPPFEEGDREAPGPEVRRLRRGQGRRRRRRRATGRDERGADRGERAHRRHGSARSRATVSFSTRFSGWFAAA